jgi:superfamily II DNA/RNA helicase
VGTHAWINDRSWRDNFLETKPFAELGLSPKVLAAVEAAGYTDATPIQSQAIPVALTGQDVLGIAQTGTGKTAAFTLPMITRLETGRARARMPRSLILAPTRELAAQVAQAFEKYGVNHKLDVALLIGGVSMDDQVKKLDRGVDVLIATPGRLLDHFGRGRIMLMGVEILVIDEADRMLDMGFIPDIEKICKLLPPRRQTLFFSATMPPEITRLVQQFLKNPVRIEVAKQATTAKTITQRYCFCPSSEDWAKRDLLRNLIRSQEIQNGIIFCNRKRDVAILHKSLVKHGFNAGALHGDMDQRSRMETLDKFRAGEITLLAASDVAARGLDIPEVSQVFNFDLPWHSEDYVHRIGRTGRAGREGAAFSIVTLEDLKLLKDIEKITGDTPVWLGNEPTAEDYEDAGKRRRGRGGKPAAREGGRGGRRGEPRRSEGRSESVRDGQSGGRTGGRGGPDRSQRQEPVEQEAARASEAAPPRENRSPRPPRQRDPAPKPVAERAAETATRTAPAQRGPKAPQQPSPQPQQGRSQKPSASAGSRASPSGGFADNVPAFLRKPARPVKIVSEP